MIKTICYFQHTLTTLPNNLTNIHTLSLSAALKTVKILSFGFAEVTKKQVGT